MKLKGKRVLVYGMGMSGRAAAEFLVTKGASVFMFDDSDKFENKIPKSEVMNSHFDLCVVSPGVRLGKNDIISSLIMKKTALISEVELGLEFSKGRLIGITGTNGKTTTVTLIDKILRAAGLETFLCGNVGLPVTAICSKTTKKSLIVCEISSFMLELTKFNPLVSCILNVTEDHIDRHGNFEKYLEVKESILKYQKKGIAILNFDDENLRKSTAQRKVQYFSRIYITNGAYADRGKIYYRKKFVMSTNGIRLLGAKNLENVLAAVAVCGYLKIKPEIMKKAIVDFNPLKNRLEPVGCKGGVNFINDSKATNVDGTVTALRAFDGYPRLLLGGRNKGASFDPIFLEKFRAVYAYGECRKEIIASALKFGREVHEFGTLKEATMAAFADAVPGEMILLSPACASFDEFKDYADRGKKFKEYFLELDREDK